jgi:tetratricopeptide (TPR) repeat protein
MNRSKDLLWKLLETGKDHMERTLYEKALKCFNRALGINVKNVKAWIWRGKALMYIGRNLEALKSSDCALLLDKNCIEAWTLKANVLRMLKQYNQESECYKKIKEIKPSFKPPAN